MIWSHIVENADKGEKEHYVCLLSIFKKEPYGYPKNLYVYFFKNWLFKSKNCMALFFLKLETHKRTNKVKVMTMLKAVCWGHLIVPKCYSNVDFSSCARVGAPNSPTNATDCCDGHLPETCQQRL